MGKEEFSTNDDRKTGYLYGWKTSLSFTLYTEIKIKMDHICKKLHSEKSSYFSYWTRTNIS